MKKESKQLDILLKSMVDQIVNDGRMPSQNMLDETLNFAIGCSDYLASIDLLLTCLDNTEQDIKTALKMRELRLKNLRLAAADAAGCYAAADEEDECECPAPVSNRINDRGLDVTQFSYDAIFKTNGVVYTPILHESELRGREIAETIYYYEYGKDDPEAPGYKLYRTSDNLVYIEPVMKTSDVKKAVDDFFNAEGKDIINGEKNG